MKLNGVRIELGEIEAILASFCKETAVVQAADHTLATWPQCKQARPHRKAIE